MYGVARAWTDAIREFSGGRLLSLDAELPMAQRVPINESLPALNTIRLPFANPPNPRAEGGPPPGNARLQPVARFWRKISIRFTCQKLAFIQQELISMLSWKVIEM